MRADFNMVCDVAGLFTARFVEGGTATFNAPFGKFLRDNMMCSIVKRDATQYRLNGGFTLT